MGDTSYKVIFQGVADGFTVEEVKQRLAGLFKVTPEKLEIFFQGKSRVIKSGLDQANALRYQSILEKAGAVCAIEAFEKDEGPKKTMVCPKCGFEQQESASCARCGIIIDKYEKVMEEGETEEGWAQSTPGATEAPMAGHRGLLARLTGLSGTRYKLVTIIIALVIGLLTMLEFVYLRGDLVARGTVRIASKNSFLSIMVDQPRKQYLVDVSTTGKRKRKLSFRLEDKTGRVIYRDTEYSSHKGSRTFTFRPEEQGIYKLYVNPGATVFGEWGYARVRVYVNDRRILTRMFGWFNF